jgi:hypothetical protein
MVINITFLFIIAILVAISVVSFIVKLSKNKDIDLLDLFGSLALEVTTETLGVLTQDISKYDTEKEFTEALTDIITDKLMEKLTDEAKTNLLITHANISALVSTILYLYKDDLKISQTYAKAKAAKEAIATAVVEEPVTITSTSPSIITTPDIEINIDNVSNQAELTDAMNKIDKTIDLSSQNVFTGKTIAESQAEASTSIINTDKVTKDFYK